MKDRLRCIAVALALAAAACAAGAQQLAWTAKAVNLRAGPDRFYPVVAVLGAGTQVLVQGCLTDYRWCDVSVGYERGWVYAGNLRSTWEDRVVPLPGVAPIVGIVVLPFVFQEYWDLHYRHRPWYAERHRWMYPPPRPAPRPPPRFHPTPPPHASTRARAAGAAGARAAGAPGHVQPAPPGHVQRRHPGTCAVPPGRVQPRPPDTTRPGPDRGGSWPPGSDRPGEPRRGAPIR